MYNVFLFLLLLLNVASCQLNWLTFHSSNSGVLLICYPRRARSALGVDTVLTLDVCMFVCMLGL